MAGEEIVFKTSKHWLAPIADSWKAVLLIIGSLILAWFQTDQADGIMGFINRVLGLVETVLMVGGVLLIVYNLFNWRSAKYMVTNQRVLGQEGLLRRRETDSLLASISDVRAKSSFVGRMFGYGSVNILTASGEAGAGTFTTVRNAEALKRPILEQKIAFGVITRPEMSTATPVMAPADADGQAAESGMPKASEVLTTLAVLASLRDAETITPQEYETKKAELLTRI